MAEIYEPLEISENGKGTGKYRMVVHSDEDDHEPIGLCQHMHDTREEASDCPDAVEEMPSDLRWARRRAEIAKREKAIVGSRDERFQAILAQHPSMLVSEIVIHLAEEVMRLRATLEDEVRTAEQLLREKAAMRRRPAPHESLAAGMRTHDPEARMWPIIPMATRAYCDGWRDAEGFHSIFAAPEAGEAEKA